ncbi:putative nuclear rna binding [Erysiphe neolycopersici]|uniref:Putative nuclear rna binding n=1 Tax=Erysiphe neolycopersici TaxID=212602 RepID=A0A420H976_9PEZI|nr:putative nuclear rna binding [Erysiphe neolycopersici]
MAETPITALPFNITCMELLETNDSTREADINNNAGNKRLFSNRESKQLDRCSKILSRSDKRQRSGSWLLAPLNSQNDQQKSCSSNEKLSSSKCCSPQPRVSRFLEGSMHDRVSQRPPKLYLDIDEKPVQECQILHQNSISGQLTNSIAGASCNERSDPRNSRFKIRKSLASTLNLGIWKLWSKDHDPKRDEENSKRRLMNERQEKAKILYQEYKRSGFFGNSESRTLSRPISTHGIESKTYAPVSLKHDSGIELGDKRPSLVQVSEVKSRKTFREAEIEKTKRQGIIFLDPPKYPYHNIEIEHNNPPSNSTTKSNHSSNAPKSPRIKTSSLINIRKAFIGTTIPVPDDNFTHKTPTRKDLQKQQKLVKRVSNLEVKLSQAKRQLAMASSGFVDNDPFQASPSRERQSKILKHSSPTGASPTNNKSQDYRLDHRTNDRRRCRRAVSFDASPQKLTSSYDSNILKLRNRSSSWNNKPLPSEPTMATDHVISRIDKDLLSRNISYFSDSDSEDHKRYSKERDFFQKFPYKSRKNKDDSEPANRRKISLFPSKDASQISPLYQITGKKSPLIKRLSKEVTGDEKNPHACAEENLCPHSPQPDLHNTFDRNCTYKPQPCQSTSHQYNYSANNPSKSLINTNKSNVSIPTAHSQISYRRNLNRLNEKNIPSLPPPLQLKIPLTMEGNQTMQLYDTGVDDCYFPGVAEVNTEEISNSGEEEEKQYDHDYSNDDQIIQEQNYNSPSPLPKETTQLHNNETEEKSSFSRSKGTIEDSNISNDHFEWPEDVF